MTEKVDNDNEKDEKNLLTIPVNADDGSSGSSTPGATTPSGERTPSPFSSKCEHR